MTNIEIFEAVAAGKMTAEQGAALMMESRLPHFDKFRFLAAEAIVAGIAVSYLIFVLIY